MELPIKSFVGSLAAVSVFAASAAAFAQGSSSAGAMEDDFNRPVPSQDCLVAMAELGDVQMAHFDERMADEKARLSTHLDELKVLAAIADDAEREAAMEAAHEEMKAKMEANPPVIPDEVQAAIDAVRAACGDMGFHGPGMDMMMGPGPMGMGGHHGHGRGHHGGPDKLLKALNMSEDELRAELDAGKSIEEIAEEKGVDLPEPKEGFFMKMRGPFGDDDSAEESAD